MLDLYNHMTNDMLSVVVQYVADDVQARSMPYRKDKYGHLYRDGGGGVVWKWSGGGLYGAIY